MEAEEELKYKLNYKVIAQWLIDLSEKSNEKRNIKFTEECNKITELLQENWALSLPLLQELRVLDDCYTRQKVSILEKQAKIDELQDRISKITQSI